MFKEKIPHFSFHWKDIYPFPFIVTIETKIREFQYKVLNNIVFTNEKMFKFKMTDSPLCSFCKREVESFEHLLCEGDIEGFWTPQYRKKIRQIPKYRKKKESPNTATLQYQVETRCHTHSTTLSVKFTALVTIRNLLMNAMSGNRWFGQNI